MSKQKKTITTTFPNGIKLTRAEETNYTFNFDTRKWKVVKNK